MAELRVTTPLLRYGLYHSACWPPRSLNRADLRAVAQVKLEKPRSLRSFQVTNEGAKMQWASVRSSRWSSSQVSQQLRFGR